MYLYDLNGNPSYFSYTTSAIKNLDAPTFQTIQSKLSDTYGNLAWMSMPLPSSIEPSGFRQTIIIARLMKNSALQTYGVLVMAVDESFCWHIKGINQRRYRRSLFVQRKQGIAV